MSILAKLLNKHEEPQDSGQIPPGLIKSVASGRRGRVQRRTYLLIAAGGVAVVVSGFLLVLYLQSRPSAQPQIARQPVPVVQPSVQAAIQLPVSSASAPSAVAKVAAASPEVKPPVIAAKQALRPVTSRRVGRHEVSETAPVAKIQRIPQSAPTQERGTPHNDRAAINAYLFAARSAEARRDHQQALNQYRQALKADPGNYRIMNNIASSLLRMGQYDEALVNVIRALTLKSDYVSAFINGGIAHSKRGEYAAAASMFSSAVDLEPDNKAALYNLALSQEKSGVLDDALTSFRRLANHGDLQGNLGMARIQEKKGNRSEALRLYREITEVTGAEDPARDVARKRVSILE